MSTDPRHFYLRMFGGSEEAEDEIKTSSNFVGSVCVYCICAASEVLLIISVQRGSCWKKSSVILGPH